jgi:GTP-binding protein
VAEFIDVAKIQVLAGRGGNGAVSVRREKYKPLGGPNGGNGGNGGSIYFQASSNVYSLVEFKYQSQIKARSGTHGQGGLKDGASAPDVVKLVPPGTQVRDARGELLADLLADGDRILVARGGLGGLGNARLASRQRIAPGFALLGEPGASADLRLELKLVADVALVGFPSAGKSTLISAISNSRPKIAAYPFTTLHPNLGVVRVEGDAFVVADVPGLIEGAAEGKGLGLNFLKHTERAEVVVHVVDCEAVEGSKARNPRRDFRVIQRELERYSADLAGRVRIVVLNKIDVPAARALAERERAHFRKLGLETFAVSAAAHEGVAALVYRLNQLVKEARARREVERAGRPALPVLRPRALDDFGYRVRRVGPAKFEVFGGRLKRWLSQTDLTNPEAVGYFSDRLAKLPIEQDLAALGAREGDEILVGDSDANISLEFLPSLTGESGLDGGSSPRRKRAKGAGLGPQGGPSGSPRGTDNRIDPRTRLSRKARAQLYRDFVEGQNEQ